MIRLYNYTFCISQHRENFLGLEEVQQEQDVLEDVIGAQDKKLQDLENQQKQLIEGTEEWN